MKLKSVGLIITLCILFFLLFSGLPPEAQSNDSIQELQNQLEEAIKRKDELSAKILKSEANIKRYSQLEAQFQDELNRIEEKAFELANDFAMIRAEEEVYRLQYTYLLESSQQLLASITEKEERSNQLIITLYKNYMLNYTAFLLSSKSINEIIDNSLYLQYLFEADKNYFRLLKEEKAEHALKQTEMILAQEELYAARSKMEKIEIELKAQENKKNAEIISVITSKKLEERDTQVLLQEYDETEYYIQQLIRRIEEEERKKKFFNSPMGSLIWPVRGPVTSPYGMRIHPIFGVKRMHTGIDVDAPMGAPLVAAAYGIVVYADWLGGYGNTVIIQHAENHTTLYAHLRSSIVDVNRVIQQGELLGYVGSTGWSTGPHLHFEVRVNGEPVDPIPYLP